MCLQVYDLLSELCDLLALQCHELLQLCALIVMLLLPFQKRFLQLLLQFQSSWKVFTRLGCSLNVRDESLRIP